MAAESLKGVMEDRRIAAILKTPQKLGERDGGLIADAREIRDRDKLEGGIRCVHCITFFSLVSAAPTSPGPRRRNLALVLRMPIWPWSSARRPLMIAGVTREFSARRSRTLRDAAVRNTLSGRRAMRTSVPSKSKKITRCLLSERSAGVLSQCRRKCEMDLRGRIMAPAAPRLVLRIQFEFPLDRREDVRLSLRLDVCSHFVVFTRCVSPDHLQASPTFNTRHRLPCKNPMYLLLGHP